MNGPQTFQSITRQVLEEHEQIHFHLEQLSRALGRLDPTSTDPEPLRGLAARVESLRERLEEHFRREDSDGLFQSMIEILPECEEEVHGFIDEHNRTIDTLAMAHIRAQRVAVHEVALLKDDLEGLILGLREHERKEGALLERAVAKESRS